jgi:hypothetical protein
MKNSISQSVGAVAMAAKALRCCFQSCMLGGHTKLPIPFGLSLSKPCLSLSA